MIYFSLFFFVAKLVVVFLSWLNESISDQNIFVVLIIFILVGLFLFMNPSVPGSTIYLVGGVMIPKKISKDFGNGEEEEIEFFCLGIFIASLVILFLKLLASALQQKLIGQTLSESKTVLRTCKVHTPFMQGIKKLMESGNRMTKIAILVGGPDWQTSVLLGILRLPLIPILINSIPC